MAEGDGVKQSDAKLILMLDAAGASQRAIATAAEYLFGLRLGKYVEETGTVQKLIAKASAKYGTATLPYAPRIQEFWADDYSEPLGNYWHNVLHIVTLSGHTEALGLMKRKMGLA